MNTYQKLVRKHRHFLLYAIIGASGALLDLIVFLILFNSFQVNAILATIISTSLGIVNNFFLNTRFNFKVKDKLRVRLLNFYAIGIAGLLSSIVIIFLLHNGFGVDANIAKIISIPIIVLAQFFLNKKISFSDSPIGSKINKKHLYAICALVLLYILFMWNATYLGFQDEIDNILGGVLINQGQIPYVDFFSHHMPLPYFVSAAITLFTGNDVDLFRYIFSTGLFIWLVFIVWKFYKHTSATYTVIFATLLSIVHVGALAHLMLAETLIAYAALHVTLIFIFDFFESRSPITIQKVVLISLLGFIPVLSSVSYLTLSLLIYVLFGIYYIYYLKLLKRSRYVIILRDLAILALPYIIFAFYLLLTHSLHEFYNDAYKFNTLYYSQFTISAGDSIANAYVNQFYTVISTIGQAFFIVPPQLTFLNTIALLLAFICIVILLVERKTMSAFLIGALVFIAGARGGIAIDPYTEGTKRAQMYVFLICFIAIYILKWAVEQNRKRKMSDLHKLLFFVAFILSILTITFHTISGLYYNSGISQISSQGVQTDISTPEKGGDLAKIINGVTDKDDTYWLGPWDFYTQMFVDRERASRFTFFLPWHSVCGICSADLQNSFAKQQPVVVYWKHGTDMLGKDVDSYNKELFAFLDERYYRINSPELKDYYFLKSKKQSVDSRLESLGYKL